MKNLLKILALFLVLVGLVACLKGGKSVSGWPAVSTSAHIEESELLDLRLRVLGLELSRDGEARYYFSFVPRVGKIEVVCRLPKSNLGRAAMEATLQRRVGEISTGVREAMGDLRLAQGFSESKHLEIRFQNEEGASRDIAAFRDGTLAWLAGP